MEKCIGKKVRKKICIATMVFIYATGHKIRLGIYNFFLPSSCSFFPQSISQQVFLPGRQPKLPKECEPLVVILSVLSG
jgi:hypothetical protein